MPSADPPAVVDVAGPAPSRPLIRPLSRRRRPSASGPAGSPSRWRRPSASGPAASPSRWRRPGTVLSLGWLALVVFAAVFSGALPLPDPHRYAYGPPSHSPSWHDWFGTNTGGQDLFSQVVHGARVSIIVGVASVAAGILIGGTAGIAAGYLRGPLDAAVVWLSDVLLTFPGLVFALALVAFLGSSLTNVVLAIAIFGLPVYARVTRGVTIALSQREYVQAAEALGATRGQILGREILPNVAIPLLAYSALGASVAIIAEGGLAFLGVSAPGTFSWGFLISQGQQELYQAPQALLAPMAVMFLTILALNVVGDHLGASLDPRAGNL